MTNIPGLKPGNRTLIQLSLRILYVKCIVLCMGAQHCTPRILAGSDTGFLILENLAATSSASSAAVIPGKFVYVTANLFQGHMGGGMGIATADTECMNIANGYPGSGIYKAMLVTDGTPAPVDRRIACTNADCAGGAAGQVNWVFAPHTTYGRLADQSAIFTTDANGVFPGLNGCVGPACLTQSFATSATEYWTGLEADWQTSTKTCQNWTVNTGGPNQGSRGKADEINSLAIGNNGGGTQHCTNTHALLCVEQ